MTVPKMPGVWKTGGETPNPKLFVPAMGVPVEVTQFVGWFPPPSG